MNATPSGYDCPQIARYQDKDAPILNDGFGCGSQTQNSHQIVLAAVGAAGASGQQQQPQEKDTSPPSVVIDQPGDLQQVPGSVTVSATIADDRGVARADVMVDGVVVSSKSAPPYTFPLENLQPGPRHIAVFAVDGAGNQGDAKVRVTVGSVVPQNPSQPQTPTYPQAPNEIAIVGSCNAASGDVSSPPVALIVVLFGLLLVRRRC
jgi:MYXO-CTERM domain-containing protein